MKLFQEIQKKFAILGITKAQSIQKQPFNRKISWVYFMYAFTWVSCVAFLFKKANTFEEYTNNIYITSGATVVLFFFTIIIFKTAKIFEFIDFCGKIVHRS